MKEIRGCDGVVQVEIEALDLHAARAKADAYEEEHGCFLYYAGTVGFVPGAKFLFDVKPRPEVER